ncbi:hypothetical protein Vretifemale_111 [Volvox reticuliferus]|uniref:Uncharacterized protein n=1 Tax=Volvox reticuliferus TaxID=1737510 RepID=A0A8J4BW10_9CHLO|nr:hypothetical protein Vretifemale_111 [Volvox reticuliferus]
MDEAAVRVFWSPSPPAHAVTSVAVDVDRAWVYTGSSDGAIVRWQLQGAVAPKAYVMLVGHTRPIRHLAPGLKDPGPGEGDEGRYLLSVDNGGGCCLWREPCGRCVLQRWIPQLGSAIFGHLPPDRCGPFAASEWLLAAMPAVCAGEPTLQTNRPHHPQPHLPQHQHHQHHHHHHHQQQQHCQQSAAPTPSLHGMRSTGSGRQAEGGGGGGPEEATALCDGVIKSKAPTLLVIDWQSLSVIQVLYMHPLQQLVCVDMPAATAKFRFSSGSGRGGSGGRPSSPTSQQRPVPPPWAEGTSGGCDKPDPSSVLLCLPWGCCAAPSRDGAGADNASGTDSKSNHGDADGDTTVIIALALTPMGTLYGCVVPYDPYKPPAWVLGYGGARNAQDGGVVAADVSLGGETRYVDAGRPLDREGQEEPAEPLMEVHEPLLSAAVSANLRWALLGAVDSWIVLEAQWSAMQPPAGSAASMSTEATSTPAPPSGAGSHKVLPRLLQMSYTPKCRISLMHQPGAGMVAMAGLTVRNRPQSPPPPSQRSRPQQLPQWPGGIQGGQGSGGSGSFFGGSCGGIDSQEPEGISSVCGLDPVVVPGSGRHTYAISAPTGLAPNSHLVGAAKEVGQQPLLIRTAAHLLLLGTWEEEELPAAARVKATGEAATATTAAGLVAAARQPYPLSGMAGPAAATSITATAAAAAAATAQPACHEAGSARPCELERHLAGSGLSPISLAAPPCPAAAPNAATCSDTLTSPSSGSMAATAAGKGIDVPRPPTPAAATAAAAAAIAVAGSTLESRVGDCDDEMLTETFSPDLARLSFAVYLPPHSDDGSSAASSLSVQQLRQAQSPPMGAKQQQQQQQQQQQPRPQLLPPNGSAQMSSGATAAMDSRHGSGEGQQSHSQLHSRSMLHEQQLQPQLSGLPPAVPKGEVSGLQVNLETAATGGDGGGDGGGIGDGGGGSTMAAIVGDAGPQQTSQLQQQQQQSLHGESGSFCMSLNQASARPIHHWHRRTNHHYHHHHGHDVSTSGAVVLQALSWDGAGRQQVVSLTSDGRILTVRELSSPAPPAPATDSFGTMEARETVWSPVSAPSPLPEALSCRAFCCYLPAQSVGDGVCNLGGGNNDGSGSGSVSRNAGAGLGGWVLGVHCYHGDARPATASVLQWPLLRQQSLPDVVLQAPPLAAEAAAAGVRAASSTDMERSLAEVNSVPLVGSLHDGWAVAAAAMWRAHTVRRRRRCRTSQRHGCGRPSSGAVTAAIVDHGAVWDSACEECPGGGCSARGTLRRYGGYDAVRDDRSDGGGNAMDDDDDDVVLDSKVDRMGRHIDGVSTTKLSYSGNGFAAAPAAAINSGGGDSLYGPPAAPEVPCRHDGGGRIRRDSSGDRGCRRLPACLYERWDARREGVSWSGGKRDCTAQQQDFPAVAKARNDGVDVGIASSVSNYPPATVVSASVLVCDGTAVGEAVVLHCMADGAIHYCGMGAYSVPSVAHWCTADDRLKHAQSSLLRASVRGHGEDGCGQGDVDGGHYDYAAAGGGNCGESSWIPAPPLTPPPAVMRPGRAGIMRGHIGPVTCQLEVLVSMMPAGGTAAAAAAARTAAANPPASPPYLPSHAHPILSDAASASGGDGANSSGSCAVRVLLTGGSDGSLRGWHTHAAVFGSPAFALHPHGAAVGRVLLPRGSETHAPPEFRQCVVSAAEDGSLALVCLERGCVIRVCRTYPYGMPEIVSWSFRRGFLACGGRDAAGQWTVAVFDIAPTAPSLDRIAVGSEAATILDVGVTSMSSSPYTSATTDAGGGQAVQRPLATPPLHQSAHHLSPSMPQVSHQHQGGLLTHPPVQHSHRTYLPPPPLPLHHTHTHVQALPHLQQQWQQKQSQHPPPPPPPYKQSSGLPGLIPPLLGHNSDGGGGGGGSGRRPWLHPVPHVGRPGCTASSASMPAPATLVAASSSSPSLAPVWAYGGSFRTIYCHRPDVLLAAINSEALLAKLSAAAMATAVPAAMTVSSPATSSPLPMPGRPGTRGLVVARSSPCQPPYGLSPSHGVLFPPNASPNQLSMSASPSREASLDLGTAVAAAATGATEISAAVSRDHSPAALPSTSVGIAAVAGCASRGSASRFSIEADRSVGGRSIGGASAGSSRLSLDVPSPPDALRMGAAATDLSGMKALAALTSILHPWASDSRVDSALLEVLVLLGILIGHRDGDPWVSGGGGGGRGEDATACSSIVAVATHESVSCHRAHSAPEGQVPFGSDGDCGRERGTSTAAAAVAGVCIGIGIGGASTGVQSATIAGAKPAAGLGGLSVGSSPQGQCLYGETQLPARRQIPDPHFEAQTDDGLSGETSRGPCLVQPALVSACGSVALGMPQAPETHGADPWVVGDPTTAAARLLHIVSLAGTLGSLGERGPPPAAHDATVYRAAVRAASCVRHLCLVTARNEVVADRAAAAIAAASVQLPPPAATPAAAGHVTKAHSLSGSCCRLRLHEPDLAMFARRWLAPDPWVREAARQLLSAYTKPWPLDTATSSIFAHVAEPYQSSPPLPLPAGHRLKSPRSALPLLMCQRPHNLLSRINNRRCRCRRRSKAAGYGWMDGCSCQR